MGIGWNDIRPQSTPTSAIFAQVISKPQRGHGVHSFPFNIRQKALRYSMPFAKLGLSKEVVDGVKAMGYVDPTPIQLRTIPLMLAGEDVIGSAQTGTGKTAAFALPILSKLEKAAGHVRAL